MYTICKYTIGIIIYIDCYFVIYFCVFYISDFCALVILKVKSSFHQVADQLIGKLRKR